MVWSSQQVAAECASGHCFQCKQFQEQFPSLGQVCKSGIIQRDGSGLLEVREVKKFNQEKKAEVHTYHTLELCGLPMPERINWGEVSPSEGIGFH